MDNIISSVIPIIGLIGFGYILKIRNYFEDISLRRIQNFIVNVSIPCMLFSNIINMSINTDSIVIPFSFMFLQIILLIIGYIVYKFTNFKRKFMPFFFAGFGFGTVAMPFIATVFGNDNLEYISLLGIGHEMFIAIIFLTISKIFLNDEKFSRKVIFKALLSPLFIMVFLSLVIKTTFLNEIMITSEIGIGITKTIANIGNITLTLMLIITGYKISFDNKEKIKESIILVLLRYVIVLSIGYAFKWIYLDNFIADNYLFNASYFTLLTSHGSIALTVFVGEYCNKEDHEVINNALVINTITGVILFFAYIIMM